MKYLILDAVPPESPRRRRSGARTRRARSSFDEEAGSPYLRPLLTDLIMGKVDVAGIADPQSKTWPTRESTSGTE